MSFRKEKGLNLVIHKMDHTIVVILSAASLFFKKV